MNKVCEKFCHVITCDGPKAEGDGPCETAERMQVEIAAGERAAIVAWLHMAAKDVFCETGPEYGAVMDAADCIASGDHESLRDD